MRILDYRPRAMTRKQRERRAAKRNRVRTQKPAGTKLLKAFNKPGMRAKHATVPQHPCYGRRSERPNEPRAWTPVD